MFPYIWDNPQYDEPILPQQAPVQRREPHAQVDVPSKIWFIPNPSGERTVMIRQEYHEIMLGILQWMHHRMETRASRSAVKQEAIEFDSSDWWLDGMPSPDDLGVVHAPPLFKMDTYPNPFLGQEGVTTTGGLVLTGLPGIGESVLISTSRIRAECTVPGTSSFLWVLFNLRIAAGLPTLYATQTPAVLWRNGKGYLIDIDHLDRSEIQAYLPNDTWCLVDSNAALTSMPEALVDDDLFIIQAASPGTNSMQWMRKVVDTHYFIMKPWDCGELIAGRQCQDTHQVPLDETQLANFHNLYGGSARDAYSFAYHSTEFEQRVAQELHRLKLNFIQEALILEPSSIPQSTTHLILSFLPIDDRKRTIWKVDSPSPHLHNRLLTQLGRNPQQKWFNLHLHAITPGSKAEVARMFDAFYHNRIIRGGAWTLRRHNCPTTTKVLIADKGIRIADRKPWGILPSSPVPTCTFDEWPVHKPFEVGTYYHATQRKFAFFVDEMGHAILFLARRRWNEKTWLEERGIQKVTAVYVTPKEGEEVSLPLEDSGFYTDVYCMHLEYCK